MSSRIGYLIKNTGLLAVGNLSSKIMTFLLVPLYTNYLTPADFGIYDLSVSIAQLLYPLLTLNIVDSVMRFAMDENLSVEHVASIGAKYVLISFLITLIATIIIENFHLIDIVAGYEWLVFAYFIFFCLNMYFLQLAKGLEHVSSIVIAGIVGTVILIICNILFLIVFQYGLVGFFAANILSQAASVIYYFVVLKCWRLIKFNVDNKELEHQMLKFCIPLIFTVIGWWANMSTSRYISAWFFGLSAAGLISISYKIPAILGVIQGVFIQAWQITAIKEYNSQGVAYFYGKMFVYINFAGCLSCSILIIFDRLLATVLYANDFYEAWLYVPFLLVSAMLNSVAGYLGPILNAKKDSKSMALSAVYGIIGNVVFSLILINIIGIQGIPVATAVSSLLIYIKRKKGVASDIIIDDYWKIWMTWLLIIIQAVVEIYTQSYIMEIILLLVIIYLYKKLIVDLVIVLKHKIL